MALSVVNFRMHHGTAMEQITFTGNGIKLLDLKKEILDKKEISRSLDFDLKIVDENGKVYTEDGEVVPKNSSIVVRRVPSRNSLVSRLNSRGMMHGHAAASIAQPRGEIVMPMKVEIEEDSPNPEPSPITTYPVAAQQHQSAMISTVSPLPSGSSNITLSTAEQQKHLQESAADEADVLKLLEEEEAVLKPTIPVNATTLNSLNNNPTADPRYNNNKRGNNNIIKPSIASGNYTCNRCQKMGHIAKNCPTIGDSSYDPEIRLMNVPRTGRKRVTTLNNIDTSMFTVIPLNDGSYEIFESSARGLEKLTKEGGSHAAANIDMSTVPEALKCPLSNTLLREAVTLPCCQKSVNDSVIRLRLVSSGLTCPLCNTPSVSPESLIIRKDIRDQVDSFLASQRKAEESPALTGLNSSVATTVAPTFPTFSPPIPTGPPPPQPPGSAPTGMPGMVPGMFAGATGMMPMGMGGMMMPSVPGMYPGMGMSFPPGFHDNPPIHALPLPLSKEQFLYEQRLQIMIMKEMNGGVLPRHAGGGSGAGGGRGGGRGFSRGGRGGGYRGGAPEKDAGPGRFPYGPADDRYQPKVRESEERYEPKVREPDLSRYQPKVRSEEEINSAKRRRDEPVSSGGRDSRRRSSSRDRERRDDSRRPSDRGDKRDRDARSLSRRRDDSRVRGSSRDRSKRSAGPEEGKGAAGRDKDRSHRDISPSERDSKRRRQEESRVGGRESERGREREKERDQGRSGRREEEDRRGGSQKPVDDRGKGRRDEPVGAGRGGDTRVDARDRDGRDRRHSNTNEASSSRAAATAGRDEANIHQSGRASGRGKELDDRKDRDTKRRGDSRSRGPPAERARESGRPAEERSRPGHGGGDRGNSGRDGSGSAREDSKPVIAEAQQVVVLQEKAPGGGGGGRSRRGRGRDRKRNRAGSKVAAD